MGDRSERGTNLNAREILFRLVVGDGDAARSAAAMAADSWNDVVQHAFRWKVLPELNRNLAAIGIVIDDPARQALRKLSRESFLRSSVIAARGSEALGVLEESGIPALAFKG